MKCYTNLCHQNTSQITENQSKISQSKIQQTVPPYLIQLQMILNWMQIINFPTTNDVKTNTLLNFDNNYLAH
jgi:hypothetical protein